MSSAHNCRTRPLTLHEAKRSLRCHKCLKPVVAATMFDYVSGRAQNISTRTLFVCEKHLEEFRESKMDNGGPS